MKITDLPSAWRSKWVQAKFRDAMFYVETDARQSGRRVALHQYPKRNTPYAEDMGRAAINIQINGYVIGRQRSGGAVQITRGRFNEGRVQNLPVVQSTIPAGGSATQARDYLTMKNELILALEKDGPGYLTLPMQHQFLDLEVMVMSYTATESRERGGMCQFNMTFVEYGDPFFRSTISTPDEIMKSAANVENVLMGLVEGKSKEAIISALQPYTQVFNQTIPAIHQTDAGRQRPGTPG